MGGRPQRYRASLELINSNGPCGRPAPGLRCVVRTTVCDKKIELFKLLYILKLLNNLYSFNRFMIVLLFLYSLVQEDS